ncbi:MAG: gfo/Idh/MocA family oxidoreductase [Verrucomicrobia bacterium]|nr:MAG: gfo/Idh/MocA family oxidoreductase [Verrucomicrobiota bacterium]
MNHFRRPFSPPRASSPGLSRRRFLGVASAGLALPALVPSSVLGLGGQVAPSNRITMGMIGCGTMGGGNTDSFLKLAECRVIAACDVDKNRLNKLVHTVNTAYKDEGCKGYRDFRQLLARDDIDAVMIAVPDHWHEVIAVEAARHKKDIYGEKPLARTIAEQQAIVKAVEQNARIWQTGSWQRSVANFHKAAEIVRNGLIGTVKRIEVGLPRDYNDAERRHRNHMMPTDPPPELDYDLWIGPSRLMPYIQARLHRDWRWNYNTGGGQLMDWVGHDCDIAHWGCDFDNSGPLEVQGHGVFPPKGGVWDAAKTFRIELKYPRDIQMTIAGGDDEIKRGTKWIGTDGWVHVNRGVFEGSKEDWRDYLELPEEMRKVKLYQSKNHHQNFLDCVKSRKPTITPVATAHHSTIPGHLGLISMLLDGRVLKWDAAKEQILDDDEASKMLSRPFRAPWKL